MNLTAQIAVPVTVINGQVVIGFNRTRLEAVLAQHSNQHPSFGVGVANAGKITTRQNSSIITGAYVGKIKAGSVADKLGLLQGDIITALNDEASLKQPI